MPPICEDLCRLPGRKHHASLTDPKAVAQLLRALDGYEGAFMVRCALWLAPLVFVRPGELRHAEWSEFDFDKAEWRIRLVDRSAEVRNGCIVMATLDGERVVKYLRMIGERMFLVPANDAFDPEEVVGRDWHVWGVVVWSVHALPLDRLQCSTQRWVAISSTISTHSCLSDRLAGVAARRAESRSGCLWPRPWTLPRVHAI